MCGLAGHITRANAKLSGKQLKQRQNVAEALLMAMQERGKDSTGIAVIKGDEYLIEKQVGSSFGIVQRADTKESLEVEHNILIGHTRYATTGAKTDKNAHPFIHGSVIGAHNGIVDNWLDIDKEFNKELKVDSEAIFALLNKTQNDYKKTMARLSGNFAITWVNLDEPNVLHIVRNSARPLYMAKVDEIDTIFWCSNGFSLSTIMRAAFGAGGYKSIAIGKETVYTIDGDLKFKKKKIKFLEKPPTVVNTYYQNTNINNNSAFNGASHGYYCKCVDCEKSVPSKDYSGYHAKSGKYYHKSIAYKTYTEFQAAKDKNKKVVASPTSVGFRDDTFEDWYEDSVSLNRSRSIIQNTGNPDEPVAGEEEEDDDTILGDGFSTSHGIMFLQKAMYMEIHSRALGSNGMQIDGHLCGDDMTGQLIEYLDEFFYWNPYEDIIVSRKSLMECYALNEDLREEFFKIPIYVHPVEDVVECTIYGYDELIETVLQNNP